MWYPCFKCDPTAASNTKKSFRLQSPSVSNFGIQATSRLVSRDRRIDGPRAVELPQPLPDVGLHGGVQIAPDVPHVRLSNASGREWPRGG